MTLLPPGVKVHLALGYIDMRKGIDGLGYVLADFTCSLSPAGWGRRIAEAASAHRADCVVAEANFGGAMVERVIRPRSSRNFRARNGGIDHLPGYHSLRMRGGHAGREHEPDRSRRE